MLRRNTGLFIILTFVSGSAGLYCLSCTDSVSPRHCHTVRKCSDGEVCFVESHTSENGAVVYDTGCASSQTCRTKREHSNKVKSLHGVDPHYHNSQCMECCSSHLCNNQGCGQPGYPMTRGPVCFDCQQVSDPTICDKIKVCDMNQVCYLQKEMEFGDVYYTSSCINNHACTSDVDIFGKRSLRRCSSCCLADLCNSECGYETLKSSTTATTKSTTTEAIKTTTKVTTSTTPTSTITQLPISMGNRGREFLILFMRNHQIASGSVTIYIAIDKTTTVNISTSPHLNANIKSATDRIMNISTSTEIGLPFDLTCDYLAVESKALLLQTSELSTVSIFDSFYITSNDGTLIIPTNKLSMKYLVSSTNPDSVGIEYYSQFAVAALYDRTRVNIRFKIRNNTSISLLGGTYGNQDVFTTTLHKYETLQVNHTADLTGTFITSTQAIAVFSGNRCQRLKVGACSHMVAQLPPTTELDNVYIAPPFYDNAGTLIQVISENQSSINVTVGINVSTWHLNEKEYKNIEVTSNETTILESNSPVLVTGFAMGSSNIHDPYMTVFPGVHQYIDYYKVVVPDGYTNNYICVIIPQTFTNYLQINGSSANHYKTVRQTSAVLKTTFSIQTFEVSNGPIVVSTTNTAKFGLLVYGHRRDDGYAFTGNYVLS